MDAQFSLIAARTSVKPRHIIFGAALLALTAQAMATWPTSYQSIVPLSSGVDRFAADVCVTTDGGVLAVYDKIDGDQISQLTKFDAAGNQEWSSNLATQTNVEAAAKYQILRSPYANIVGMQYVVPTDGQALSPVYQKFHMDGSLETPHMGTETLFATGADQYQGMLHLYFTSPWTHAIEAIAPTTGNSATISTEGQQLNELTSLPDPNGSGAISIFACTRKTEQIGERSQVLVGYFLNYPPVMSSQPVLDQGSAVQSNPKLTASGQNVMVNWIAETAGNRRLYTRLTLGGGLLAPGAFVLEHVDNYVATSSTLGVPVFAAVQRPSPDPAEMDTLIGGLINPETGETAALTIASASDIKVKALREEGNGDFSLVYSISEGGTNLLKVRRISGTSAATLWETTVADLGIAPDERIERYPNTFVSGKSDGVLFILTRYDQPYTHNTAFNLVRLRADGQLGGE